MTFFIVHPALIDLKNHFYSPKFWPLDQSQMVLLNIYKLINF